MPHFTGLTRRSQAVLKPLCPMRVVRLGLSSVPTRPACSREWAPQRHPTVLRVSRSRLQCGWETPAQTADQQISDYNAQMQQ